MHSFRAKLIVTALLMASSQAQTAPKPIETDAAEYVRVLNARIVRTFVFESDDVWMTVWINDTRLPQLKCFFALSDQRRIRLVGDNTGMTWLDFGSNEDRAWLFRKEDDTPVLTFRHIDTEKVLRHPSNGIQKLFLGSTVLPQLFGKGQIDTDVKYRIEHKDKTWLIEQPKDCKSGMRRIVILDSDDPRKASVVGYEFQDVQSGKTQIKISVAKYDTVTKRHFDDTETTFRYPSAINVVAPADESKLEIRIGKSKISNRLQKGVLSRYFNVPTWPKEVKTVDIAANLGDSDQKGSQPSK